MKKEKQKIPKNKTSKKNYEDKDKREFIKKNLFGIGIAGITIGVLTTPLSKAVGNSALVPNLNVEKLDGYLGTQVRCACSWSCYSSCTGSSTH